MTSLESTAFKSGTERNRCQEDRGIPEREARGYAAKAS
jgi:hypothetical protein